LLENSYNLIYVYLKEYNYIIRKEVDTRVFAISLQENCMRF